VHFGRPRLVGLLIAVLVGAALPGGSSVAAADNVPPVAVDDPGPACMGPQFGGAYPVPEDWGEFGFVGICAPTFNDSDPDGSIVAWQIVSPPSHGTVRWARDFPGILGYTPDADFSTLPGDYVSDSLTYQAIDDRGAVSNVATLRIWVAPINDPPRFLSVPTVVVDQDSGPYSESWLPYVVAGPSNESGQTVHFITTGGVIHSSGGSLFTGSVTFTDDGQLTFTPTPGQYGYATITLYLQDDGGLENYGQGSHLPHPADDTSDPVTFTIIVKRANTAPIAVDDNATLDEDAGPTTIQVRDNDTDAEHDNLYVSEATNGGKGVVSLYGGDVRYTPNANANGSDAFTYTISDGFGGNATATVHVTINPVNDRPTVVDDTATFDEDSGAHTINVLANDSDVEGDALAVTQTTDGSKGAVVIAAGGTSVTYTPNANANGPDSFTYTVSDGNGGTSTATVRVTINPVNDAPVAVDDSATFDEDADLSLISVLTNDTDVDGDPLQVIAVTNASNGATGFTAGGTALKYRPNANFNGSDAMTYTISDGHGGIATAVVHVTVNSVNDPPDAVDDGVGAPIRIGRGAGPITIAVLANDTSEPDGPETLQITSVTQGSHGTVAIGAGGATLTYDPAGNTVGPDSFTYTISDGHGGLDTATVQVDVARDTTAPVVSAPVVGDRSSEGGKVRLNVSWTAQDAESGIDSSQLQVRRDGGDWSGVNLGDPTAFHASVLVNPGHTYEFRVRATNGSSPSLTSSFVVGPLVGL
jgi:hypothetical protein